MNPTNTVFYVKRLIGRSFDDKAVQGDMKHWPFKVVKCGAIPKIEVQHCGETKRFVAEEISFMVLSKMKQTAETSLNKIKRVVITVTAYFNISQRRARIDAAKLAAAIAYGMDKRSDRQRNVLIFDWGGGTFDVSIMSKEKGKFDVKTVGGDTHLGGEDINSLLVDHCVEVFKQKYQGKDLITNKKSISRLREACEKAKRELSAADHTDREVSALFEGIDFTVTLTRARFEQICSDLFNPTMEAVKSTLSDAKLDMADIHNIVLVGRSTRIPKVRKMLQDFFDGRKVKRSVNPDKAVVYGATLLAASLTGAISQVTEDLKLLEVTPLSLGVEIRGGVMSTVIKRNTPISTVEDNQESALVKVYEGKRAIASGNNLLGEFLLSGLPLAPSGKNEVKVAFKIDENGILHVSAMEVSTGKQSSITITNYKGRLSGEEVERMLADAKKFRQKGEKKRSRMAAKNLLVNHIYNINKKLESEEIKQTTSEAYRQDILAMCEKAIKWTDREKQATKEDYERMCTKFENVSKLIVATRKLDL
ncbi:heat shock protein 70 related [Echinococcus multilocularis]|uniref:Heat shock protein 70 related n=1 Tax=Echinococcus multilocularis TaxID=6211 RepID=A0A068XTJ4_ECHMU|nr:heat shock protein 70 related [Echinococcus multilocularis]